VQVVNKISVSEFQASHVNHLLRRAQRKSEEIGLKCELSADYMMTLWSRCEGSCAISGHPFTNEHFEDCLVPHPFFPSIDRIDCHKGYTKANTRLVCVGVNFGMNQWGEEVYLQLAEAAARKGRLEELDRINQEWFGSRQKAIQAIELRLASLDPGSEKDRLRRHLAALKATLKKGPKGRSAAARKAGEKRKARRQRPEQRATLAARREEPKKTSHPSPSEYERRLRLPVVHIEPIL
jgi:hypothetical protein